MADNYVIKDGTGASVTMKSKDVGTGIECIQSIASDTSGAALIGQKNKAGSLPVAIASDDALLTAIGDASQKTQIVSGTGAVVGATSNALDINIKSGNPTSITANAGTNLNTSGLALETGGNLATLAGSVASSRVAVNLVSGQAGITAGAGAVAANTPRTTLASDDPLVAVAGAKADARSTATDTTAISLMQVLKQCSFSLQALVTALGGTLDLGAGTVGSNTQRVTIGTDDASAVNVAAAAGALGATTGAAVITDANGTIQQYLRGLIVRWLNALGAGTAAAALRTTLASDDPAVATLGATSGSAVITDATGTIQQYLRGLVKQWIAGTLVLGAGTNVVGKVTIDPTTRGTSDLVSLISGQTAITGGLGTVAANTPRVTIADLGQGEYVDVAASSSGTKLGATGAVGDYLAGVTIFPETTAPGEITLQDGNTTAVSIFKGGTASVSNLVPFYIPFGDYSKTATTPGWTIVTGANAHVRAHGNFT